MRGHPFAMHSSFSLWSISDIDIPPPVRQGNHNIAILAYNYLDHHNAICLVIALHCNAKSHHDILGDQVMDGAVLVARILFS